MNNQEDFDISIRSILLTPGWGEKLLYEPQVIQKNFTDILADIANRGHNVTATWMDNYDDMTIDDLLELMYYYGKFSFPLRNLFEIAVEFFSLKSLITDGPYKDKYLAIQDQIKFFDNYGTSDFVIATPPFPSPHILPLCRYFYKKGIECPGCPIEKLNCKRLGKTHHTKISGKWRKVLRMMLEIAVFSREALYTSEFYIKIKEKAATINGLIVDCNSSLQGEL